MKLLNGIIHVTGEHDTGKTTFALECGAEPGRICFFDDDVKGRATVSELMESGVKFGAYHDLAMLNEGRRMVEYHEACLGLIDGIQPGHFDAIVWDTWTRFASTCRQYVFANPDKFRLKGSVTRGGEWADAGRIKGAEMNQEAGLYEARLLSRLSNLARTVVVVTHLKSQYLNNAKTGKSVPAHGRTLDRVPRMRIWLRQNPSGSPVPIGLFLKRFDRKYQTDDGLRTVCVVPRKIVPAGGDKSLWDTVWRYWDEPVGTRLPTADETPNEFELSILDGTLTRDQKRTFELMLKAGLVETDEPVLAQNDGTLAVPTGESADRVKELAAAGKSAGEIARELSLPLPEVSRILKGQ